MFILVVPSSEFIPPRGLHICDEGDPQGLIQYIKQHRSDQRRTIGQPSSRRSRDIAGLAGGKRARLRGDVRLSAHRAANSPQLLTLEELSRDSGVGERTLEYGFREVYGTTPLNFARSLRLTRSRMALLRAKSYTPINEIASAFGFRHMGQYSRDYRRWFGETPSMTLART